MDEKLVKPLPLTQDYNRINAINHQIKAIHKKSKKSPSWSSSVDLSSVFQPNLNHKPSEDAELSLEEDGIKRFKKVSV